MYLDTVNKSLEIILAGAITTNQLPWVIDYGEVANDNSTSAPKNGDGATNSTTAVTLVAAPGSNLIREVLHLTVFNADTAAATVTVRTNDNGTTRIHIKAVLQVGESLCYESPYGWYAVDTTGARKTFFSASSNVIGHVVVDSGTVTANAGTNLNTSALATVAKQPALGTAGTASADVLSVQGIASMTPMKVDGSGVTQPVSGTVTANQGATWTVQPGNTANTTAWKVDGSAVTQPVSFGPPSIRTASGTITTNGQSVQINTTGCSTVLFNVFGTYTGTLTFYGFNLAASGISFVNAILLPAGTAPSYQTTLGTQDNYYLANVAGFDLFAVFASTAITGSVTIYMEASVAPATFYLAAPLPTGSNVIGGVTQSGSNWTVNAAQMGGTNTDTNSGNKSAGTQRVVLATDQPALTNALKVDGSGVTQPVSGTVTANIGTSGSLALDASVNGLLLAQASTTSGEKGPLLQGAATSVQPTTVDGKTYPLNLNLFGAIRVDGSNVNQPVTTTSIYGTSNIATGQVSIANTATSIVSARGTRRSITVINHGTTDVFLGGTNSVTTSTGLLLIGAKGTVLKLDTASALWAIVASGSQTISFVEEY